MALLESVFSEIKLPRDLYDKLVAQLKEDFAALEGVADGSVFQGKGVTTLEGYPTFDVKIPGALLHLPPQLYFVKKDGLFFLQIVANDFEVMEVGVTLVVEHGATGTGSTAWIRNGVPVREGVLRLG